MNERLNALMHFAVVQTGLKQWHDLNTVQRLAIIEIKQKSQSLPPDFDITLDWHCIVICGAAKMKVRLESIEHCLKQHAKLKTFVDKFERSHGPDAMVRLRTDLVFEAESGRGITPLELSLLAAIYSIIGRKQGPVRITQDYIHCRALGYKSEAVMAMEISGRGNTEPRLTEWIVRSRLESLRRRRFFVCTTYGRRLTYYSHRMTQKQLEKAVYELKTHNFASEWLHRRDCEAMTDAIRNQRASLNGLPPSVPDAQSFQMDGGYAIDDIS